MNEFRPMYITLDELSFFGLPSESKKTNIANLIQAASILIDEHCGRIETTGNGSFVYSTYEERLTIEAGLSMVRLSYRPLAAVSASVKTLLQVSGNTLPENYLDTGFTANTILYNNELSPIISCQGRFVPEKQSKYKAMTNVPMGFFPGPLDLQAASSVFGVPSFTDIDVAGIDFDPRTGDIYIPVGLYPINEIRVVYNSGFDGRSMPLAIKNACAQLVRNYLGKGATGVVSYSGAGGVNVIMEKSLIDQTIERYLRNYMSVLGG